MAKVHSSRFTQIVDRARGKVRECTVQDIVERRAAGAELTLIDVREESEFANEHIPGACHLGKGVIERDVEEKYPDTATELVLYCGGGYRSALAALNLQLMGYANVISMDGGFRGWKEANQPVTVPDSK
jgi:rhodanese-related sulfurtransferase